MGQAPWNSYVSMCCSGRSPNIRNDLRLDPWPRRCGEPGSLPRAAGRWVDAGELAEQDGSPLDPPIGKHVDCYSANLPSGTSALGG